MDLFDFTKSMINFNVTEYPHVNLYGFFFPYGIIPKFESRYYLIPSFSE